MKFLNDMWLCWYDKYLEWFCLKRPNSILKSTVKLGEEVGEVCEAVAAFTGSESKIKKMQKKGQTPREALIEELGDVIVVVHNIATLADITHAELYEGALDKACSRITKISEKENVRRSKERIR